MEEYKNHSMLLGKIQNLEIAVTELTGKMGLINQKVDMGEGYGEKHHRKWEESVTNARTDIAQMQKAIVDLREEQLKQTHQLKETFLEKIKDLDKVWEKSHTDLKLKVVWLSAVVGALWFIAQKLF